MTALALLIVLIGPPAYGQDTSPPDGTKIVSAQVSGITLDRLSSGLRDEIDKLPGTPLDRQLLKNLATRIESEHPRLVAGVRTSGDAESGARVIFVVARLRDADRDANVNTRYVVDDVEIRGVSEDSLEPSLRDELHALTGKPLDPDNVDRIETRLGQALSDYDVSHRTVRGGQPGRIKLVFDLTRAESARWLQYEPLEANGVYHSDQGWGAVIQITGGGRDMHATATIPIDTADDLIEEYSGIGLSFDTRKLGTERLGAFFEWSTYDQSWRDATLAALAANPGGPVPYRNRMSLTPLLKVAIVRHVSLTAGVNISELDELSGGPASQMANAAIGSIRFFLRSRESAMDRHDIDAAFTVREGTRALQSDLVYQSYLAQADYSFRRDAHRVLVSAKAGGISGDAPLFERFSLGDSKTLRGWNKYDIAPAGGDRLFYASVEYRYRDVGMFLDTGAVWNDGTESRPRVSTGVTFTPGPLFFTLGFPVNTNEFRAVFTMGFRYSNSVLSNRH
jgi:hypothetical protein